MRFYSPLRYPGGKRKLVPFIRSLIEVNELVGCDYVEPYAGGANVALQLMFEDIVQEIYINDISVPISSFWKSVLENSEALCEMIISSDISMKTWTKQKRVLENPSKFSSLEIGFATFFLNRTNFSGVLSGGVIGGKNQTGNYKMNARFNKAKLIERIERIAELSDRIHIYNQDAKDLILNVVPTIGNKKFLYLDPPYYMKGRSLYSNYYEHEDHEEICNLLSQMENIYWVVSYDDVGAIRKMYVDFEPIEYALRYNANKRYVEKEVLFCSEVMEIPGHN